MIYKKDEFWIQNLKSAIQEMFDALVGFFSYQNI